MTELLDGAWPVLADWRLPAAVTATIVAGLMRGYSGFGTAVILAPVYSLLWGPRAGVPVMLLMELLVSLQLVPSALKDADRRVVLPLGILPHQCTAVVRRSICTAPTPTIHTECRRNARRLRRTSDCCGSMRVCLTAKG